MDEAGHLVGDGGTGEVLGGVETAALKLGPGSPVAHLGCGVEDVADAGRGTLAGGGVGEVALNQFRSQ